MCGNGGNKWRNYYLNTIVTILPILLRIKIGCSEKVQRQVPKTGFVNLNSSHKHLLQS